jgi:hypothetical protein
MVSFFENTQNVNPTTGKALLIQAEISKKQTNFGVFATAEGSGENVHQSKRACKKRTNLIVLGVAQDAHV